MGREKVLEVIERLPIDYLLLFSEYSPRAHPVTYTTRPG